MGNFSIILIGVRVGSSLPGVRICQPVYRHLFKDRGQAGTSAKLFFIWSAHPQNANTHSAVARRISIAGKNKKKLSHEVEKNQTDAKNGS